MAETGTGNGSGNRQRIVLSEMVESWDGSWEQHWHCNPPRVGIKYVVLDDRWENLDGQTERHIFRWRPSEVREASRGE